VTPERSALMRAVLARRYAMERDAMLAAVDMVAGADLGALAAARLRASDDADWADADAAEATEGYYLRDGVAVIEAVGVLAKQIPWCAGILLPEVTSTVALRQAVEEAAADARARAILLLVDSPGGEVAGTQELADAIAEARQVKPVHAHISDLGASAAYWIASQASTISANRTARIGSVGVYAVLEDWSEAYAEHGITVHVLASGANKGVGVSGAAIPDEQLEAILAEVNGLADLFIAAVATGRGMDEAAVRALADGRCYLGAEALAAGLIDHVENSGAALARVAESSTGTPARMSQAATPEGGSTMALFRKKRASASATATAPDAADPKKPEDEEEETPASETPPDDDKKPEDETAEGDPEDDPEKKPDAEDDPEDDPEKKKDDDTAKARRVQAHAADVVSLAGVIGYDKAVAAVGAGLTAEQALLSHIAELKQQLSARDALIAQASADGESTPARTVRTEGPRKGQASYGASLDKACAGIEAKLAAAKKS